jgi:hypothetical protein
MAKTMDPFRVGAKEHVQNVFGPETRAGTRDARQDLLCGYGCVFEAL